MARGKYQKSDTSRERIIEAATELFSTRGYAGSGVDRLAERSGIAKTAIYYHFGNKEGLLAAVLERAATQWIEGIQNASRQAGDPIGRLDRALAGMRAMLEERPWIYKLFQILALEMAEQKPEVHATLQGIIRRARLAITDGMREALGVEVPDADGVAGAILATLDGVSLGLQLDPERVSLDQVFADLRRVTAFLIATRLNADLARMFDGPEALRFPGRTETEESDDERSRNADR
ncbi:MAG: TetR/AcrR family transcriptional regulator [Candidatus Binatia bacterium]